MDKKKLTPILLMVIGLIAFLLSAVIGLIYTLKGDIIVPSVAGVLSAIFLYLFVDYLVKNKTSKDNKKTRQPEYVLLGLYLVVALIMLPFNVHFININILKNAELKNAGHNSLGTISTLQEKYQDAVQDSLKSMETKAKRLFNSYRTFKRPADSDELSKLLKMGSSSINYGSDSGLAKSLAVALEARRDYYLLDSFNSRINTFVNNQTPVFENWEILKVTESYIEIDSMYSSVLQAMQALMSGGFSPIIKPVVKVEINNPFWSVTNVGIGLLILIILVLAGVHLLILGPYLVAKTPSKLVQVRPADMNDKKGGKMEDYVL